MQTEQKRVLVLEDSESHVHNYLCGLLEKDFLPQKFQLKPNPQQALAEMMAALYNGEIIILEYNSRQVHLAATFYAAQHAVTSHRYKLAFFDNNLVGGHTASLVSEFLALNPQSRILLTSNDPSSQKELLEKIFRSQGKELSAYLGKRLLDANKPYHSNKDAIWDALDLNESSDNQSASHPTTKTRPNGQKPAI